MKREKIKATNRLQEEFGDFTNSDGYFSTAYVEWLENKLLAPLPPAEGAETVPELHKWTAEEYIKGCEHDGSFIPVHEVIRLMNGFAASQRQQQPTSGNAEEILDSYFLETGLDLTIVQKKIVLSAIRQIILNQNKTLPSTEGADETPPTDRVLSAAYSVLAYKYDLSEDDVRTALSNYTKPTAEGAEADWYPLATRILNGFIDNSNTYQDGDELYIKYDTAIEAMREFELTLHEQPTTEGAEHKERSCYTCRYNPAMCTKTFDECAGKEYAAWQSPPTAEGAEEMESILAEWAKKEADIYVPNIENESDFQRWRDIHFGIIHGIGYMRKFATIQHTTAEGAEEILNKHMNACKTYPLSASIIAAMQEFATLHAQRIAEKMVEEKTECNHKGTTIAWGPGANKCTKCGLTWDV